MTIATVEERQRDGGSVPEFRGIVAESVDTNDGTEETRGLVLVERRQQIVCWGVNWLDRSGNAKA